MTVTLLDTCVCGSKQVAETKIIHGIECAQCACGIIRQVVRKTPAELGEWYREQYHKGTYGHTFPHDLEVGRKRLNQYGLASDTKLLDVGCGNGGFLAACKERGINARGQEVSAGADAPDVYVGELEDIAFPTDGFDVVTMHDVLEHVLDPMAKLKEIRRILRRPGKFILDFPNFWVLCGAHHWKQVEHLWMFTDAQLIRLVKAAGFRVNAVKYPIPSKIVLECEPEVETRPQIMVPAGIGDAYWVMTKLPGFLKAHGLGMPDLWVQDAGGPKRTQPYLRNLPMINAAGYKTLSDRSRTFHEAYMQNRRTVFSDEAEIKAVGVDHYIAYNGVMRAGRRLEDVDPQYGCDWFPKMFVSKEQQLMQERMVGPGRYIATYWPEAGMYRHWLSDFPVARIVEALRMLSEKLDARIVITGASWDRGQAGKDVFESDDRFVNLMGSTTFDQLMGLFAGASAVVGFPAGNTILATMLYRPTVLLWNEYFDRRFWANACPPVSNYAPIDTNGLTPSLLVDTVLQQMSI